MRRVIVAGHLCVDLTPGLLADTRIQPGQLFDVAPLSMAIGGCVANTGGDLADLGMPVRVHTAVGDDELGRIAIRLIDNRAGMIGTPVVIEGANTSYSLVLEPPGTDRTFWHHTGANNYFNGASVDFSECDLFHLGYPPLLPGLLRNDGDPLEALLERGQTAGVTTSVDLAVVDRNSAAGRGDWNRILRRMTSRTDVLSPSIDDLVSALGIDERPSTSLAARLAEQLIEWGAAVVMITAGSEGLILRTAGRERLVTGGAALSALAGSWADVQLELPPLPVAHAVTTNGAGDAATAGLLYSIAAGASPKDAAMLAAACSAAVISSLTTTPETIVEICPDLEHLLSATPLGGPSVR